ncbi:uncharacterized protein LOC124147909 [Haliotis rufescens]|uniref:uncharacterized protein LOC124147909 n=1 Tax=Haliotis rufescens TaxID=6454 RepID=UPI00201EAF28|nr:uncharacterized protein LOC124147909 [Haliotis rufescens]XP_048255508.1 uncharacterized protein LOC124147909 [Haliotis rufescens]
MFLTTQSWDTDSNNTSSTMAQRCSDFLKRKKRILICLIVLGLCTMYITHNYTTGYVSSSSNLPIVLGDSVYHKPRRKCPNVLSSMLKGTWKKRKLTYLEETEMELFLLKTRGGHNIPMTLDRLDGRCGNVTFDSLASYKLHPLLWFRALCNPRGDKPCCFNGMCVRATEEQCRCPDCYDMRQQIHAEYATWTPANPDCQPKQYTQAEACSLLKGSLLYITGDSFIRHIYTALILLLRNDYQHGAILPTASEVLKKECQGMYMFTEKMCRQWLDRRVTVCDGTVNVVFNEQIASAYGASLPRLTHSLANTSKSLLVIGIGIHENYNPRPIMFSYLHPLLDYLFKSRQAWPRVLWAGPHAPGILKTPRIPQQNYQSVLKYNSVINDYLTSLTVPVFDTFNLTDGVMSFDGAHYGLGVNKVKVQILLNYIQELSDQGMW